MNARMRIYSISLMKHIKKDKKFAKRIGVEAKMVKRRQITISK